MGILNGYILRSHLGPFFFALATLTGLLFLNAVAQKLEILVGKGLGWQVFGEFVLLTLPHTVALTLPMAVLVAVLYTFSQLTAQNEIVAMAAGGVKPIRLLLPLLAAGALVTGVVYLFNDQVLPEANHRLKNLTLDLNRKSPTLQLREQVVNEIRTADGGGRYFLRADRIDRGRSELESVVIYDLSEQGRDRTTFAERGSMAFNEDRTDLYLTLYDGEVHEVERARPETFRRTYFEVQVVPLRGVGNVLERTEEEHRGDREMTVAMLRGEARERVESAAEVREEARENAVNAVLRALGREAPGASGAAPSAGAAVARDRIRDSGFQTSSDRRSDPLVSAASIMARTQANRIQSLRLSEARYRVEIHKKLTIAFACLVFVLVGAPLAVRFPRGGVGLVILASVGIFSVYYMGLKFGETLADRGMVSPFWGMWAANIVFLAVGLLLARDMGRKMATSRGGGWDELRYTIAVRARRIAKLLPRRRRPVEEPA